MKRGMSIISALLVFAALSVGCYGQSATDANIIQPNINVAPNVPVTPTAPAVQPTVPAATGTVPGITIAPAAPAVSPNVPATPGAGPVEVTTVPNSSVAVDNNYVYVLQEGKLYRYDKASVSNLGIPVPSRATTGIFGAVQAGQCLVPSTPALSGAGAAALACLQGLTGLELDKAYLMAMINSQSSVIAISEVAGQYGSRTSVQDFGINAASDARGINNQFQSWLRTKYCVDITVCPTPSAISGFNICDPKVNRGRDFDITYANQALQYYTDEIALSQHVLANGCDCEVRRAACEIIKADQEKVRVLREWLCNT